MNSWLVVDNNEYKVITSKKRPKGVKVISKVGDAVYHFDPGYVYNYIVHTAVVTKFDITNIKDRSTVFFSLKTATGNQTIARGQDISPVPLLFNWVCRWWINKEYDKNQSKP